jgi:C1A family cysteine protease
VNPLHQHPGGHGYGWRQPRLPARGFPMFAAHVEASALPAMIDLRPKFQPAFDQNALGSCTANAWAGLAEYLHSLPGWSVLMPSRLFIYYLERMREGDVVDDTGASLADGAAVCSTQGCPHERMWPYDITKFAQTPPPIAYSNGLIHRLGGVTQVSQDLASMKAMLNHGLPIAIGFTVYSSFESVHANYTGIIPMPSPGESIVGGHAVLIVGCDDAHSWFICRNSWGTDWGMAADSYGPHDASGNGGYFTIPYAYLTDPRMASDFWSANAIG